MNLNEMADSLDVYSNITKTMENIYDKLGDLPASDMIYNFRDALCHYVKCYENFMNNDDVENTDNEFIKQEANLVEHLDRGLKDGFIYVSYLYSNIITCMMREDVLSCKDVNRIREYLHEFKNLALDIRGNGLSIIRVMEQKGIPILNRLENVINNFEVFVDTNITFKEIYEKAKESKLKKSVN